LYQKLLAENSKIKIGVNVNVDRKINGLTPLAARSGSVRSHAAAMQNHSP
jgi:hypothetical protein